MARRSGHSDEILVVDDDPVSRRFFSFVLERRAGMRVTTAADPDEALAILVARPVGVLVTDIRLPGCTGLELARTARKRQPDLPVILVSAHATMDDAVDALRLKALDLLAKPVDPTELIDKVTAALAHGRRVSEAGDRVLAIGAHPDDVEIGVGGTLAAHVAAGDPVTILTLTQGSAGGEPGLRAQESNEAARRIGAHLVLGDLVDTALSEGGLTVALIESVIADVRPTIVYTHTHNDVHQDHRATHSATLVAARGVDRLYTYQSPSATVDFRPTRFSGIDDHLETKVRSIAAFGSQTSKCAYLAEDLIRATARYWGRFASSRFAEPLEVIKDRAGVSAPAHTERASFADVTPTTDKDIRYARI